MRNWLLLAARTALACAGIAALVALIASAGADTVRRGLVQAAPWLPLLIAFEGCRIGLELVSTRHLLGQSAEKVSWRQLLRLQLMAYGVCILAPAGRPASEAVKAAGLAPQVGTARATAIGTYGQVLNLLGEATLSGAALGLLCLLAPGSLVRSALVLHFLVCAGTASLLLLGVRTRLLARLVARVPRLAHPVENLRAAARELPGVPLIPFLAFVASKALQVAILSLLLHAGGVGFDALRLANTAALNSLAAAVGDLVPAQLGTTDGVFALGANLLGAPLGTVLVATALFHFVQLLWVASTAVVALLWRPGDSQTARAWRGARLRAAGYKAFAAMLRQ
jgi:hypothetical protein